MIQTSCQKGALNLTCVLFSISTDMTSVFSKLGFGGFGSDDPPKSARYASANLTLFLLACWDLSACCINTPLFISFVYGVWCCYVWCIRASVAVPADAAAATPAGPSGPRASYHKNLRDYLLLLEYEKLKDQAPPGIYVVPAPYDIHSTSQLQLCSCGTFYVIS